MRNALIALWMLLGSATPALAQLSIDFEVPGASIGINLPAYPQLQRVPGYPVYYAPGMNSNYFFYDGLYWVYQGDNWYASSWYNGPWGLVDPVDVPVFVLRVPVRYYRERSGVLPWLERERFAALGRSLGPVVGEEAQWMGPMESQFRSSARAVADLPAAIRGQSISASHAAGPDPEPELSLPAQRCGGAAALPAGEDAVPGRKPQQAAPQQQAPRQQQQSQRPQQQQQQAQPHVAQLQQAEHKPQQAPVAREQQAAKQPQAQAQPKPKPQQTQQTQQPQQAAQAQHPEHKPQQAPVAHGQQAPHPQAHEKGPQGKEQPKPQGKEQAKEQPKEQGKEQGKEKDNAR